MYWDYFEMVKGMYPASWALGCRSLPAGLGEGRPTCSSSGAAARSPTARSSGRMTRSTATYVLGMEYADWKALHEGYDAQRTVMYRKILLEDGDLLEFFKTIYFFAECLAVIGGVPADYPELAAR